MLKNGPTNSSVPRNSARDIKTSRRLRQGHDISKSPETGWIFNQIRCRCPLGACCPAIGRGRRYVQGARPKKRRGWRVPEQGFSGNGESENRSRERCSLAKPQPATASHSPSPVGGIGQDKLDLEKTTPSGSKCRVPAAPITGPLKSPSATRISGAMQRKCELAHNRADSFHKGPGSGPRPFLQTVRSVGCSSTGPLGSRTILVTSAGRNRSKISSRSRAISRVRTSLKGGTS
jgi:hypothetical protein